MMSEFGLKQEFMISWDPRSGPQMGIFVGDGLEGIAMVW